MRGNVLEDAVARGELGEQLRDYVAGSRWFRAKTRTIAAIEIEDAFAIPHSDGYLLVLSIAYADESGDHYILPLAIAEDDDGKPADHIAHWQAANGRQLSLRSALGDEEFRRALLNVIVCEQKLAGRQGTLLASRTPALKEVCSGAPPQVESFVSRAEQSNTSIIYRNQYILKLFRKLEAGVNPDVEIGNFLTARGFENTPAVLGNLEYRRDGQVYGAGLLQAFVANQGDAWAYTLKSLEEFFARVRATSGELPLRNTDHPLELSEQEVPKEVHQLMDAYLASVALLGRRTAEMHIALTDDEGGPDFAPEAFTSKDRERLERDLVAQADIAFELLRRKQAVLSGGTADAARRLLHMEDRVAERFAALKDYSISTVRIRHHGDYHLGQVLYTGRDFMIIDFEGEPARPLEERRAKALALRDVAGMVRSFQYAAFAALFEEIQARRGAPDKLESAAAAWNAYAGATFLKVYFDASQHQPFVPADLRERRILLDAFLLQKALYELAYELNNRPDWLQIPLRGILSLIS
jgi:maltose alpha-D-glucosyltransferase / alpha-amylase